VIVAGARPILGGSGSRERRDFRVFLAAMFLFTLGNSTDVFLVLHAHELGVPPHWAVLWIVLHLSKTAFATPADRFADRFGRRLPFSSVGACNGLGYLGFAWPPRGRSGRCWCSTACFTA
jgi:MFS family permease